MSDQEGSLVITGNLRSFRTTAVGGLILWISFILLDAAVGVLKLLLVRVLLLLLRR
jgi:hypothetical protein